MVAVKSIRDEIEARGATHEARLLDLSEMRADLLSAERFGVPPGSILYASRMLHLADGVALQLEERLVNPLCAPDYLTQDIGSVMPHDYLMEVAPLDAAEHVIEAELPNASLARLLDMPGSEPVLILSRRTWSAGRVASFVRLTHPASRYQFSGRIENHPLRTAQRSGE
jgi:GntR family histidine utilization transcriptional repressor